MGCFRGGEFIVTVCPPEYAGGAGRTRRKILHNPPSRSNFCENAESWADKASLRQLPGDPRATSPAENAAGPGRPFESEKI